jgi:hypothetical protein
MDDEGSRGRPFGTGTRPRQRIRADLERRGVATHFSEPFSERLAQIAGELSASEYHAAILAMTAAYEVVRRDAGELDDRCRDVREIRHLMQGFADELRKLEEGLRVVSAYLVRLRSTADGNPGGQVH